MKRMITGLMFVFLLGIMAMGCAQKDETTAGVETSTETAMVETSTATAQ